MRLTWRRLERPDAAAAWGEAAAACRHTTFYETPAWAETLRETFPVWSPAPAAVEYSDGNLMVLPMMERRAFGGMVRYREGMLPGVYGGPLFLRPPREEHWEAVWETIHGARNAVCFTNPFITVAGRPRSTPRQISTWVLDLTQGVDSLWKGYRRELRREIRVAERQGVEVSVARDPSEVDAYYAIYQDALRRWGSKASGFYPRRLFHTLFARSGQGQGVRLWVARMDGRVVGGAWNLYHHDHVVGWHGLAHTDYMKYHSMRLLLSTIIADASREGLRWYDLGTSGGSEGVEFTKRSYGAQPLEMLSFRRLGLGGKAFRGYRHFRQRYLRRSGL